MTTEEKIFTLKNRLRDCDTEDILGIISLSYSTFADAEGVIDNESLAFDSSLMSPQKQRLYLAGLLMSTTLVPVTIKKILNFRRIIVET